MSPDYFVNCVPLPAFRNIPVQPVMSAEKQYIFENLTYDSYSRFVFQASSKFWSAKIYTNKKRNGKENSGLTMIRRSDCFTCHASKSKLIGPSFEMIAKKYKMANNSVNKLTKKHCQ